jgi:hypothetical protein
VLPLVLHLTAPVIDEINDANGNEEIIFTTTASAVNELTIANAATGNAPEIAATGDDTNIDLRLNTKGTGGVVFNAGAVATPSITTTGDTNTGIFFPAADNISFSTNATERLKIESDGKIRMDSATLVVDAANNRVGIGTSVPSEKFEVFSQGATAMTATINATGSGLFVNSQGYSNTMTALSFNTNYGAVGSITCAATTAYNTTSDYRLKNNISNVLNAIDRVKQLKPIRFSFIVEPDKTVDGFLAHEVQDVVPEAITGKKDEIEIYIDKQGNEKTRPVYQGIDQSKLVPLLTAGLQEAIAKIEQLEARITTLENK